MAGALGEATHDDLLLRLDLEQLQGEAEEVRRADIASEDALGRGEQGLCETGGGGTEEDAGDGGEEEEERRNTAEVTRVRGAERCG